MRSSHLKNSKNNVVQKLGCLQAAEGLELVGRGSRRSTLGPKITRLQRARNVQSRLGSAVARRTTARLYRQSAALDRAWHQSKAVAEFHHQAGSGGAGAGIGGGARSSCRAAAIA